MDFIDRIRRVDVLFPDPERLLRSGDTGLFDESESVTSSGRGAHDVIRSKPRLDQFCCGHRLEQGLAPASTEHEENLPVLIRRIVTHRPSPNPYYQKAHPVHTSQPNSAKALSLQPCLGQ